MIRLRWRNELAAGLFAAGLAVFAAGGACAQADDAGAAPAPDAGQQQPAAQSGSLNALSGGVAALVNDDVISTYDLRQRALLFIVSAGVPATQDNLPQIQQEALRSLIDEHLEMQELRKTETEQKFTIIATDDEVDAALQEIASDNNTTLDNLKSQFARAGLDVETLRSQIRAQISWQRLVQGRYGSRVRIGPNQIAMMQQRLNASASQPQYLVSEIFIDAARAGGLAAATDGANQLITQIQQGAPFGPVARQFSAAPTAAANGDMGWVSTGELQAELAAALEQMRPGQLSGPIPVSDGVYVLQLRDRRAGGGSAMVSLKQAAVRLPTDATDAQIAAANQTLTAFRATGAVCSNLESKAAAYPGLVAGDLGESPVTDLAPEFRTATESLQPDQFSNPVRTSVGLHLIMVCGRRTLNPNMPTREQIEDRLEREQLSMLSRRHLRDLRNSATIETP